jgi:hypothetical protein
LVGWGKHTLALLCESHRYFLIVASNQSCRYAQMLILRDRKVLSKIMDLRAQLAIGWRQQQQLMLMPFG